MKLIKKTLTAALSLTLCAAMVVPGFAASFTDLQNAIDGVEGTGQNLGDGVYGYGQMVEGTRNYEIEAWDDGDTRNVKLYGTVENQKVENEYGNTVDEAGVEIGTDDRDVEHAKDVILDLNGQTVEMNQGTAFAYIYEDGTFTLKDSTATGTEGSEDDPYTAGKVVGGVNNSGGSGLITNNGGTFTMDDGILIGYNENGNPNSGAWGVVVNRGVATINGGVIEDSQSWTGGGVHTDSDGIFNMNGGHIEGNKDRDGNAADVVADAGTTLGGSVRWLYQDEEGGMKEYVPGPDGKVEETVTIKPAQMDEDGNIIVPAGKTVIDKDGKEWGEDELPFGGKIDKDGNVIPNPDPDAVPETPDTPAVPDPAPVTGGETEIENSAIPLASGPVTRAQFIDYLWRHEGEPAAESELFADHEYAPAIAWALSVELIDEEFQPDELVTVAAARDILASFEAVFGAQAVAADALTTLTGADDEAVLNCGEVLAEFFGEELAAAA